MKESLEEHRALFELLHNDGAFIGEVDKVRQAIEEALLQGRKVLIAGNGGSAADAQHFATEFVATFRKESRRGYPVLALTTDTSFLTAWGNDFGFDDLFARQVQTFATAGDVFIGISTSGNSENILRGVRQAKQSGARTIGLLGNDGGKIKPLCDIALVVPSATTARIQEAHEFLLHSFCEAIVPKLQ